MKKVMSEVFDRIEEYMIIGVVLSLAYFHLCWDSLGSNIFMIILTIIFATPLLVLACIGAIISILNFLNILSIFGIFWKCLSKKKDKNEPKDI
ncbi:hypothetical protein A9K75_07825 [Campylobacter fetus subsp. testudinum]|uniref:hypothetical protein n=1 Tax=Campylobacter fetus TaxID=196 RepID=UPI0008187C14|nr:hypothetical protein [Campylobacter fetus]OCR99225.1 hypothetical protein A9K75_07825 [Campylobacter fetus subsp. testudinum]